MRAYNETKATGRLEEYAEWEINFEQKESDTERVLLVIDRCPDGCMPLWVKDKIFKEPFPWWTIHTYVYTDQGCIGKYNPQHKRETKRDSKGKIWLDHFVVNFDWVLPATEENRKKIIAEVSRLAFGE